MQVKKGGIVSKLLETVNIPKMFRAKQYFSRPIIEKKRLKMLFLQNCQNLIRVN